MSKHKLQERASRGEVSIICVDLAKNAFQVHGVTADGAVEYRKKLSRPQFARFMADQPTCLVAMEARASAHHWARETSCYGHEVRLIAPHYVKPLLKLHADGWLLMVNLTPADISDSAGAKAVLRALRAKWPWMKTLFADSASNRAGLMEAAMLEFTVEVVRKIEGQSGFQVLPRRWVVESTFAWMTR